MSSVKFQTFARIINITNINSHVFKVYNAIEKRHPPWDKDFKYNDVMFAVNMIVKNISKKNLELDNLFSRFSTILLFNIISAIIKIGGVIV